MSRPRPDRFSKAIATGTDIVIVDWDAVAPILRRKREMRSALSSATQRTALYSNTCA